MILDENLFEDSKESEELSKLKKEYKRRYTTYTDDRGEKWVKSDSKPIVTPDGIKHVPMQGERGHQWFPEDEVNKMTVKHPEPITEGKNLDDIVYDKLSRIKLSKGKDGKPRHPEVYANPKGNGFKLELDDEVGVDQAAKIAKEHGLNHNVKKVRDYIEVTIDTPERKAFTETYSKSSLEQEIRNKVRETFPNFADDEYAEYIGDYLVVEIVPQDGRTKVEVRADLTYKMMDKIADNLNPIVQKLDKDAYFDHEDTGIINAFVNSKDLKESVHKTKLAEWVSNFRKKSTKTESLMQDIQADHARVKDEYGQEVYDALEEYTAQGNDLGKVLYSEDGWKAFEEFCNQKGIKVESSVNESVECRYTKEEIDKIKETLSRLEKELEDINAQIERIGTENSAMGRVYLKQKASIEERISNCKEAIDEYSSCVGVTESIDNWSEYLQNCKFDYALSKLAPLQGTYIDNKLYQKIQGLNAQWQLTPVESEELVDGVIDLFGTSITESFEDEHLGNSNFKSFIDNFIETHKALIKSEQQRIELLKQSPDSFNVNVEDEIKDAEMRIQEHQKKLNEFEKLKVNGINESIEETPEPGPEAGIASLINRLIVDEWEAIQGYNDAIVAAETEGYSDIAQVLRDIANEENLHVGQLEQCMKTISPNAESIDQGEIEAEGQLEPSAMTESVEYDFSDVTNMSDAREILKKYGIDLIKEDDRNYILKKGDKKYTMYILDNPNEVRKDLERAVNKLM